MDIVEIEIAEDQLVTIRAGPNGSPKPVDEKIGEIDDEQNEKPEIENGQNTFRQQIERHDTLNCIPMMILT
jgi:hypothetical protein